VSDAVLAIIGTRKLGCPGDVVAAIVRIYAAIDRLDPLIIVSGGADGVDTLAEQCAIERGYTEANGRLVIFRPRVRRFHGPGGFRWRDELISRHCTHLLRIACRRSTTYGSGWTADEAERNGAVVVRHYVCEQP